MIRLSRSFRRWLAAGACASALLWSPAQAKADPISASIVAAIGLTGAAATVATFVITTALQLAGAFALSKLTGPKQKQQERQASVTTLSVGESPREAVFGRVCSGGSLAAAANFGGEFNTDWEVLEITLADHPIDALEGYFIGSDYYAYSANGLQTGFSGCLDIEFINGSNDVPPPTRFAGATGMASEDRLRGVTKVWAAYKANDKVWPQGRPSFKWVFRGKRCYDPRKDSTVPGGSGSHRWNAPSTWEWTDNAYVCRYNWVRGVYARDLVDQPEMLLVGRGLTDIEAPPENVFAPANVCDELVPLKAGGTEPRYRVSAVIRADETHDETEQRFAAAMAGVIVQREGGVEIEPGQAKSTVVEITDADLVVGEKVVFDRFLPAPQRINSVVGRYIEPAQNWSDHAAPIRRSVLDIQDDRGPAETPLSLDFVTSGTQAQRCAEIERRLARMERRATIPLPPRFSGLEEGDWIGWTSDRRHHGGRVVYRVEAWSRAPNWRRTLALREVASSAYGWTAATDEITPGTPPPPEPARPDPLALSGVDVFTVNLSGDDGSKVPAIRAVWSTPVDPAVLGVRVEVRVLGEAEAAPTSATTREAIDAGFLVTTNGVAASATLEARVIPLADPSREVQGSDWTTVVTGKSTAGGATTVPWSGVDDDDGQRPEDGADVTGNHTSADTAAIAGRPRDDVLADVDQTKITTAETALTMTIVNGETVEQINQLQNDVNGNKTFIQDLRSIDGEGVGKAILSINSNGHVGGTVAMNDGTVFSFYVVADEFGVVGTDGVGRKVVYVDTVAGKIKLTANVAIDGDLTITGTLTTRTLANNSVTIPLVTTGSSTINCDGTDKEIIDHVVDLTDDATLFVTCFLSSHFPSGDKNWNAVLYIDGVAVYTTGGANGEANIPLGGALFCAAGEREVKVTLNSHSSVNVTSRTLSSLGPMR
ncbi:phage tail protein [Caulobacter sp. UNC279MFTsu5.1]|uniref:phage tail protein n=1 Tax=Caulobacter sp. UNC279MFTsu5.1 TaxID=1502775 RepID=UPI0008E22AA6|nr:phage tail protein [Caulobacter sp. UNC279MFTsu5.1]SFK41433.1 Putative phage tail protein [Caulobacter sp. UNC279MFTsu5.1]